MLSWGKAELLRAMLLVVSVSRFTYTLARMPRQHGSVASGIRTHDFPNIEQVLYQLSYRGFEIIFYRDPLKVVRAPW